MSRPLLLIPLMFALACGDTAAPVSELPALPAVPIATPRTGEIVVSWQDASDNETGFRVEVSSGGGPWLLLRETAANTTSVTHPNVLHEVLYLYRIAACNDSGCSEFVETSAKWQTGERPIVTSVIFPQISADYATFRASVRTGGLETHVLFSYRVPGSFYVTIGPVTIPALPAAEEEGTIRLAHATAFGLSPDTEYTVSVSAYNKVGSSLTGDPIGFRTRPLEPVIYDFFNVLITPPYLVRLSVQIDPAGLETTIVGEVTPADADFSNPTATQTVTRPPTVELQGITLSFTGLESGKDYKARMVLRNALGSVATPVRTFRMP